MNTKYFSDKLDVDYNRIRNSLRITTRDYHWRMNQLQALKRMIVENDDRICQALWFDLRKSKFECVATEQGVVISEIDHTLKHLAGWMKPIRVTTPLFNQPGVCSIHHDPLGLALIIGAWNYPIQLLLAPLVGAIAGGNAVVLKPSELAVQTADLVAKLIPLYLDKDLITVVEAGPEETGVLLDKKFDTIFFTGSGTVGKIVMTKAAVHLTPVTLELGGKSPAIVLSDADIEVAAKRIAWGKFMNAGQTCVAPDYVLVEPSVKEKLVAELKKAIAQFYPGDILASPDFCRIINQKNFDRLKSLLDESKIISGGESRREELFLGPTLINANFEDAIMQDEIFGPLLPIIEVADTQKMISFINSRPKPLALYLFTSHSETKDKFLNLTSSGGVCVNDVVLHLPVVDFPFGGVGASGMGHYHGKYSFTTFTHEKGVLEKATWIDIPVRYAPYNVRNLKILSWLFK